MKHLLNNMTEKEKNSIREQYDGVLKVQVEKFSKLVESTLGDVKPYLNEVTAESFMSQLEKIESMMTEDKKKKLESCASQYPQLKNAIASLVVLGMGVVSAVLLILAWGLEVTTGSLILMVLNVFGIRVSAKGIMEILKDFDKNELVAEAKKVLECASINVLPYGI